MLLFVIGDFVHPGFASFGSVTAVLVVASFVGLVAAGQTFVVLIGGIDLSVPWVLNGAAILLVTSSLGQDGRAALCARPDARHGRRWPARQRHRHRAVLGVPAVVMTLAMNGIMEGLTLGLSGGMTCAACASYAPPVVQDAVHGSVLGIPAARHPVGRRHRRRVVRAESDDLRPQHLCDRQQSRGRAILPASTSASSPCCSTC